MTAQCPATHPEDAARCVRKDDGHPIHSDGRRAWGVEVEPQLPVVETRWVGSGGDFGVSYLVEDERAAPDRH